jgi:transcription initiation factor IIE alpha subunit
MLFKCPECGSNKLFENEIGPVITREVRGIHSQYHHTVYDVYWASKDGEKWWTCGDCGWRLPVSTTPELIKYLEGKLDSTPNHLEPG